MVDTCEAFHIPGGLNTKQCSSMDATINETSDLLVFSLNHDDAGLTNIRSEIISRRGNILLKTEITPSSSLVDPLKFQLVLFR